MREVASSWMVKIPDPEQFLRASYRLYHDRTSVAKYKSYWERVIFHNFVVRDAVNGNENILRTGPRHFGTGQFAMARQTKAP
tara:strand:+ start:366 stop:611 length:246 start_codon:yes stop_codon:yes gene_type:complete